MPVIDKALSFLFIPTNTPKEVKRPRKLNWTSNQADNSGRFTGISVQIIFLWSQFCTFCTLSTDFAFFFSAPIKNFHSELLESASQSSPLRFPLLFRRLSYKLSLRLFHFLYIVHIFTRLGSISSESASNEYDLFKLVI